MRYENAIKVLQNQDEFSVEHIERSWDALEIAIMKAHTTDKAFQYFHNDGSVDGFYSWYVQQQRLLMNELERFKIDKMEGRR